MADAVWDPSDGGVEALASERDPDSADAPSGGETNPLATGQQDHDEAKTAVAKTGMNSIIGSVCPKCGVGVVDGYVSCPKCNAKLPRRRRLQTHEGGGTAVRANPMPWIFVLGAAIATAGAWYLAESKSAEADVEHAPNLAEESMDVVDPQTRSAALDVLEQTLGEWDLSAWVDESPKSSAIVVVYSHECDEPKMQSALRQAEFALAGAGWVRAQCLERGGRLVSSMDLVAEQGESATDQDEESLDPTADTESVEPNGEDDQESASQVPQTD